MFALISLMIGEDQSDGCCTMGFVTTFEPSQHSTFSDGNSTSLEGLGRVGAVEVDSRGTGAFLLLYVVVFFCVM